MAGQIKHSWNGTVLTIESDSGISSADLKGAKGDTGIRGAQGRAGEGAFAYEDFTPEQLAALKGEKGEDGDILLLSTAKGKAISINDSSNSNIIGLNMSGAAENPVISVYEKNVISYPYTNTTKTASGITFTDNGDSTITISGTATSYSSFILRENIELAEGLYTFGKMPEGVALVVLYTDTSGEQNYITSNTTNNFEWVSGRECKKIYVQVASGVTVDNTITAPVLAEGAIATQTVTIPYTFTEGDFLTLENGRVNTVAGDITDTETGQAILALHTNKPNTTIISDMDCSVVYKADITTAYNNLLARVAALEGGNS